MRRRKGWTVAAALLTLFLLAVLPRASKDASLQEAYPAMGEAEEKVVYLTFDDGPSAVTEEILDYMDGEGIQATFFVIGMETERAEKLLNRMKEEGHAVGLHSYSHDYGKIYASPDAFFSDQKKLRSYLEEKAGLSPSIFRFPGGSRNSTAPDWVLAEIKARAQKENLSWFDWNAVASDSGSSAAPAETMAENIIESGGEKERILVLMHDNSIRTTAVPCLKIIVPYYREKGYRFEKLESDTPPVRFPDP